MSWITSSSQSRFCALGGAYLFASLLVSGCAPRVTELTAPERSERLAKEEGRVLELNDPVSKTKSYIVIADLVLKFAWEATRDDERGDLDILFRRYIQAVRTARATMMNSGRDPARNPAGFRELEAGLRAQLIVLKDIQSLLFTEDHPLVLATMNEVHSHAEEISKRLQ